jgi:hypothetical protein
VRLSRARDAFVLPRGPLDVFSPPLLAVLVTVLGALSSLAALLSGVVMKALLILFR